MGGLPLALTQPNFGQLVHILTRCGYTPISGVISALGADILTLAKLPETLHPTNNIIHHLLSLTQGCLKGL